ncbi:pantoate--beta-alanine ligase [Ammoniphilus resinae]|nr:pantoate--beta-alanine ligase [Ammoniphilus resinae]
MRIIETISEMRKVQKEWRENGESIGLVPTMGYLHEGHLSLIAEAKKRCSKVVMSLFVNPLQFGPTEDFERYPRDMERDSQLANESGVDIIFAPSVAEMYPHKMKTTVVVSEITDTLCGASRPGHFDGVATVVSKLFHIVQPDFAFFGQKDAQQVAVIKQMVDDLNMPLEIIPCPIVREPDGLAKSSRNVYLSEEARKQAVVLSRSLKQAEADYQQGLQPGEIKERAMSLIKTQPLADIDYVELLTYPSLKPLEKFNGQPFILALAVRFGDTRLIDNKIFS